jgi:hypothetical protein
MVAGTSKMANKDINWWVVIGVVALILLIGKFQFTGILATFCENTEPKSISEFQTTVSGLNGTIQQVTPTLTIMQNGSNMAFQQYSIKAPFGELQVFPTEGYSCSSILAIVDKQLENTSYVIINERQVLLIPYGLLFCNYANNLALLAPATNDLSNYMQSFTVCESREVANVTSNYVEVESECIRLNGIWKNSTCICEDGDRLPLNSVCEETSTVTTSGSTVTQPTTPTETRETTATNQWLYIAGGIIIVLVIAYWVFEKGPEKGLIKRRKR